MAEHDCSMFWCYWLFYSIDLFVCCFRTNGLKRQLELLVAGSQHGEITGMSAKNLEDLEHKLKK